MESPFPKKSKLDNQKMFVHKCKSSELAFTKIANLINHYEIKHKEGHRTRFYVSLPDCEREYQNKYSFKSHVTKHFEEKKK